MTLSPYSTNKPIRIINAINYIEQPTMCTCGQTCLAMLADVSVDEIYKVMGNDSTTSYENLTYTFDYYGFRHRLRKDSPKILPDICLLKVQFPEYWHGILFFKKQFYDPKFGIMDIYPSNGRIDFKEFIEVYQ